MSERIAGMFEVKSNGFVLSAKGDFTFNLGRPKRDGIVDSLRVIGYGEKPQIPFMEGMITDFDDFDVDALLKLEGATVTVKAGNTKTYMLEKAWYAGEGDISLEKGEIQVRFEGKRAEVMS